MRPVQRRLRPRRSHSVGSDPLREYARSPVEGTETDCAQAHDSDPIKTLRYLDEIDIKTTRVMGGFQGQSVVQMEDRRRGRTWINRDAWSTFAIALRSGERAEFVLRVTAVRRVGP